MTSSSVTKDHGASDERDLHAAIMNLPSGCLSAPETDDAFMRGYRQGHKVARHQAAELAAAHAAGKEKLLEALKAFMALDRSFTTICDEHLNEMAKEGPMARAVKLAREAIAKHEGD